MSEEKKISKQNFRRVKLEDVEFEKYFEVYGTDQLETRYLLTPALMARIVDFRRRTKQQFQFSFHGSKVYLGIYYPMGKGLFAAPLFAPVYSLRKMEKYAAELYLLMEVVNELNLNAKLVSQ